MQFWLVESGPCIAGWPWATSETCRKVVDEIEGLGDKQVSVWMFTLVVLHSDMYHCAVAQVGSVAHWQQRMVFT